MYISCARQDDLFKGIQLNYSCRIMIPYIIHMFMLSTFLISLYSFFSLDQFSVEFFYIWIDNLRRPRCLLFSWRQSLPQHSVLYCFQSTSLCRWHYQKRELGWDYSSAWVLLYYARACCPTNIKWCKAVSWCLVKEYLDKSLKLILTELGSNKKMVLKSLKTCFSNVISALQGT